MSADFLSRLIDLAIEEDLGSGDVTSDALLSVELEQSAVLISREPLVICGHDVAARVFGKVDERIKYDAVFPDGAEIGANTVFGRIYGPSRSILGAERIVLNFLQRLSGIATQTARLVAIARPSGIKLLDTRKTTPGWRVLEKYAVKVGGGVNHRQGLYDAILIKNNHIDCLGGDVAQAVSLALAHISQTTPSRAGQESVKCEPGSSGGLPVEVEVRSEKELLSALNAGAKRLLLDNMPPAQIIRLTSLVRSQLKMTDVFLEVSGGINEGNLRDYLIPGIDAISLGALTHSVRAADISLRYSK